MRTLVGVATAMIFMIGTPASAQRTEQSEAEILATATCESGWYDLGFFNYAECYTAYIQYLGGGTGGGSEPPYGWVTLPGGKICRSVGGGPIYGC